MVNNIPEKEREESIKKFFENVGKKLT